MSRGDALPDPNWDEFDPNVELDYDEDPDFEDRGREEVAEPSVSASSPFGDPQEPSSSRSARVASADSLPVPEVASRNREVIRNIGPSLPPGFVLDAGDDTAPEDPGNPTASPDRGEDVGLPSMPSGSSAPSVYGPVMPRQPAAAVQIGPSMPPNFFVAGPSLPEDDTNDSDGGSVGPPPEPSQHQTRRVIGPSLPGRPNGSFDPEPEEADVYGPALPGNIDVPEEDDDDMIVGPMPAGAGAEAQDRAAEEYARRRLALEEAKEAERNVSRREEWMVQLPQKLTNYGLGARTFSKGGGGEKDSSWTETPQQKRLKMNHSEPETVDVAAVAQRERDRKQEQIAKELNKNRNEALLDSHMKQRKNAVSNGASSSGVRRPFDREKDMEVRGFSNSTSEEIKKKCGNLGSRFGASDKQKYL